MSVHMESNYTIVSDSKRRELIRLVKDEGYSIVKAAKALDIKYDNAKFIMRTFRLQKRTHKISHIDRFGHLRRQNEKQNKQLSKIDD